MDNEQKWKDPLASFDQSLELLIRSFPAALFSFYSKLKDEGFSEHQAFDLTKEWLQSMSPKKL